MKTNQGMLIPQTRGERPLTQIIMAKVIKASFLKKKKFVDTGCLSLKLGFKRSVQEWGLPNGGVGRQVDGVTEAEHRHNKLTILTF